MCGIAGITGNRDPAALQAMLDLIGHRGPDDDGQRWIDAEGVWVGLGNRRLAILDLSDGGHQPMSAGGYVLAYNGEVYNFPELRRDLEGSGVRFRSRSDTEVVLQLLAREGLAGLRRLNGMFALALWDSRRRRLLLARDRFGIKPLYYRTVGRQLLFGSEVKCLFAVGPTADLDLSQLGPYLAFGWVPGHQTLYQDVLELPPGCVLLWRPDGIELHRYRDVVPEPDAGLDPATAAAALRDSLEGAVRRQLVADVPVGVLLSGGLDSSAVAALAARHSDDRVRAYTIGFRPDDARFEQNAGDAECARLVAGELGLELQEFVVCPDVAQLLEGVAWHLDDPVADPAAILTFIICRAAAPDVKVLLSGQGSDELFGGYRVHLYDRLARSIIHQPRWARRAVQGAIDLLPSVAHRLPLGRPGLLLAAHRAGRTILDHAGLEPEERYVAYRSAYYYSENDLGTLLTSEAAKEALVESAGATHMEAFGRQPDLPFFDRMLYVDFKTFLANQNLAYSDRLSMAASVELRVPFLDDEVADLALRIPEHLKVRRLRGKAVLRQSVRDLLPDRVIHRRKAPFAAPIRSWLRGPLAPLLHDALSDEWLHDTGLFDRKAVRSLLAEHASGQRDHTYRIWTLLTFAMWHRVHVRAAFRPGAATA